LVMEDYLDAETQRSFLLEKKFPASLRLCVKGDHSIIKLIILP
jgi:hypothetical protein